MGVLKGCKPREEVLKGDLQDAIFAAHFGDVITGSAPKVYKDAGIFFRNTYPTKRLKQVVQAIFSRLADADEPGATVRLSTGYGGGKTHTLIALWHLGQHLSDASLGTDLLPLAGRPSKLKLIAVDAQTAGHVVARHGDAEVKSLWGEIVYGLGGKPAWRKLGVADDPEKAHPDEPLLLSCFPEGPVLILLDEIVMYMATLSHQGRGNLLGFLAKLAAIASKRPQTVLVVTDPAAQYIYTQEAEELASALALDDLFGKYANDYDPIGDEAAKVIVTRLFDKVKPQAAQAAAATYHALYERVLDDTPGALPRATATPEYAARIVECYPFHPRLLDTAQGRLGSLKDFHRSRGVLRLFGRIIRDTWEAKRDLDLISAGDINWSSERIQADLLQRLNKDEFKACILADIDGHAAELDGGPGGIHRRVASALLLESLPMQPTSGMDAAELTLAVLRPDEAGAEPTEALDHLVGVCWHTYPMAGGRGWQFRIEPNVNRLIEERMVDIPVESGKDRVLAEAQGYYQGAAFKLAAWPATAAQVPDSPTLQLALCASAPIAESVCKYCDDSGLVPRRFVNAVVAVAPTPAMMNGALDRSRRLLAAEAIERQHRTGDEGRLIRMQLDKVKPDLQKRFRIDTRRAFNLVVLADGQKGKVEEEFQVPDEEILQHNKGQEGLKKFLEAKKLIYPADDALAGEFFAKRILPGATPLSDQPSVYTAKAVHERFLSAPGLRLVPDSSVVRATLRRAVAEGQIVLRVAERAYDRDGYVDEVSHQRLQAQRPPGVFALDASVFVALAGCDAAKGWLKVEAKPGGVGGGGRDTGGGIITPPIETTILATNWEDAIQHASERPLEQLKLIAATPADASRLAAVAQPFGADSLSLLVEVYGNLKAGGQARFQVTGVKLSHPINPLGVAQVLFNALTGESNYTAVLDLRFEGGRREMQNTLEQGSQDAPEGLKVNARFGKPGDSE